MLLYGAGDRRPARWPLPFGANPFDDRLVRLARRPGLTLAEIVALLDLPDVAPVVDYIVWIRWMATVDWKTTPDPLPERLRLRTVRRFIRYARDLRPHFAALRADHRRLGEVVADLQ